MFYYLLLGASEEERKEFKLLPPEDYFYLKQVQSCPVARSHPDIQQFAHIHFMLTLKNPDFSLHLISFYPVQSAQPTRE